MLHFGLEKSITHMNNIYISFVIQSDQNHSHDFEIVNLPKPKFGIYGDNSSQEVIKWLSEKQSHLPSNEKIVLVNYFIISNID